MPSFRSAILLSHARTVMYFQVYPLSLNLCHVVSDVHFPWWFLSQPESWKDDFSRVLVYERRKWTAIRLYSAFYLNRQSTLQCASHAPIHTQTHKHTHTHTHTQQTPMGMELPRKVLAINRLNMNAFPLLLLYIVVHAVHFPRLVEQLLDRKWHFQKITVFYL